MEKKLHERKKGDHDTAPGFIEKSMLSTVSVVCRFDTIDADYELDWFTIWNSFALKANIKCLIVKQAFKEMDHNFVLSNCFV